MKSRTEGAVKAVYQVTNNFEQYLTSEPVSQEYISAYVAHCMIGLRMPLSEIKFEYKIIPVFVALTRVWKLTKENKG